MFLFLKQYKNFTNIVSNVRNAINCRIGFAFFVKRVDAEGA